MGKSDRELRSGTRKDYATMADVNSDSEGERCPDKNRHVREPGFSSKNKNNNNDDGGEIINNEFMFSDIDSKSGSDIDGEVESSDEEVRIARQELEQPKLKQKDRTKQLKLEKMRKRRRPYASLWTKVGQEPSPSDLFVMSPLHPCEKWMMLWSRWTDLWMII